MVTTEIANEFKICGGLMASANRIIVPEYIKKEAEAILDGEHPLIKEKFSQLGKFWINQMPKFRKNVIRKTAIVRTIKGDAISENSPIMSAISAWLRIELPFAFSYGQVTWHAGSLNSPWNLISRHRDPSCANTEAYYINVLGRSTFHMSEQYKHTDTCTGGSRIEGQTFKHALLPGQWVRFNCKAPYGVIGDPGSLGILLWQYSERHH